MHHHDRDEHDRPRSADERAHDPLGGYLSSARSEHDGAATWTAFDGHRESAAGTPDNGSGTVGGDAVDATGSAQPGLVRADVWTERHGSTPRIRIAWDPAAPLQRLVDDLRASIDLAATVGHDRLVRRGERVRVQPSASRAGGQRGASPADAATATAAAPRATRSAARTVTTGKARLEAMRSAGRPARAAASEPSKPNVTRDRPQNARNLFLVVATLAGLYMVVSGLIEAFS